jgi:hypothetical protein
MLIIIEGNHKIALERHKDKKRRVKRQTVVGSWVSQSSLMPFIKDFVVSFWKLLS